MKIDIEKVSGIVRDVAQSVVLPYWRNLTSADITEKTGPTDLVTIADKESEKALHKQLTSAYPGTLVVGEEGVEADRATMQALQSGQALWIIDPIDGTMAFSRGQPQFDIMLALVKGSEMLAAWIYAPVDDDFYMSEKGAGVIREVSGNRTQLKPVDGTMPLHGMTGIIGKKFFSEEQRAALIAKQDHFKKIISTICAGHDYSRLLRGEAQFAVYNKCMPWDHVPGLMLASELGFGFSKHDGTPYHPWDTEGGIVLGPKERLGELRGVLLG